MNYKYLFLNDFLIVVVSAFIALVMTASAASGQPYPHQSIGPIVASALGDAPDVRERIADIPSKADRQ